MKGGQTPRRNGNHKLDAPNAKPNKVQHKSDDLSDSSSPHTEPDRILAFRLSYNTTDTMLRDAFSQFGEVSKAIIAVDKKTRCPAGCGLVTMASPEATRAALAWSKGLVIDGKSIGFGKYIPEPPDTKSTEPSVVSNKILVSQLSLTTTATVLRYAFTQFGEVTKAIIAVNEAGRNTGCALVTMATVDAFREALAFAEGLVIDGKHIEVCEYTPKSQEMNNVTTLSKTKLMHYDQHTFFKSLLLSQEFSDVTIIINETRLCCHKLVLGMHSPVFRAMFNSGMMESITNEVVIDDFSMDVVKVFLEILYTNEYNLTANSMTFNIELFKIAHKYDVRCQDALLEHIRSNVTSANCFELLKQSNAIEELTQLALKFIGRNYKLLAKTKSEEMTAINPEHLKKAAEYM